MTSSLSLLCRGQVLSKSRMLYPLCPETNAKVNRTEQLANANVFGAEMGRSNMPVSTGTAWNNPWHPKKALRGCFHHWTAYDSTPAGSKGGSQDLHHPQVQDARGATMSCMPCCAPRHTASARSRNSCTGTLNLAPLYDPYTYLSIVPIYLSRPYESLLQPDLCAAL